MAVRYVPGVCNIGAAEVSHRRLTYGWGGLVLTFALYGIIYFLNPSFYGYLVLAFPLYLSTIGFIQAKENFCAAYGRAGVSNMTEHVGENHEVIGQKNREKDRLKSKQIFIKASVLSGILTIIIAYLSTMS
jgi:hypothetical protein